MPRTLIPLSGSGARTAVSNRVRLRDSGTCLSFSSGTRVQVSSSLILSGSTNLTISAWIRPTSEVQGSSGGGIYSERHPSSGNDILRFAYSEGANRTKLRLTFRDDSGTLNFVTDTATITKFNTWYHVALVKTGTAIQFYINGVATGTGTLTATDNFTQSGILCQIGNDPRDGNSSFFGLIDDVQINNTNLTLAQIQEIYYGGLTASSALGRWLFDEGSGTSVTDSTGTQSTGTITGATYTTDKIFALRTLSS